MLLFKKPKEPFSYPGVVAAEYFRNTEREQTRCYLGKRPKKERFLYLSFALFLIGAGLYAVFSAASLPFPHRLFPSVPAFLLIGAFGAITVGISCFSTRIRTALLRGVLAALSASAICGSAVLVRDAAVRQGTRQGILAALCCAVVVFSVGAKTVEAIRDGRPFGLEFFERDGKPIGAALKTDLQNRDRFTEVTLEVGPFRGYERYYLLHVSRRLMRYCRRRAFCFVGLRAALSEGMITYCVCLGEAADEKRLGSFLRGFRQKGVTVRSFPDPDRDAFHAHLPDQNEMYRMYLHQIFSASGVDIKEGEQAVFYPVLFSDAEKAASFSSAARVRYPDVRERTDLSVEVRLRMHVDEVSLYEAAAPLLALASGFGGEVAPPVFCGEES